MPTPKIIQFPLGLTENIQYHYTEVNVSSAEILTLNSAPKTLVSAPGAGKMLIPIHGVCYYHFVTTAYDATNNDPQIKTVSGPMDILFTNVLSQAADYIVAPGNQAASAEKVENEAIILTEDVDPTLGDGTLTIYLWYINLTL